MADEVEHVEAIAVTANALEQIERANIDIQISTAKAHPRSMEKFYQRATAMVTLDEVTAASCLYRRPVGKEGGMMKYAEGESVRLAEIVAASYGNVRVAGRITEMTPRYVKAQGVAHDLETNTAYTAEVVESTVTRQGVPFSERMRIVVAKSAQSKAIRDAIFRVIPKSLCKPLADKAKVVAQGDAKTFESRKQAVVDWIKSLNIDAKRVWDAVGIEGVGDITMEVLVLLAGLKTALAEGDCTIDEAFPKPEAEQAKGRTADRIKDKFKGDAGAPTPSGDKTEPSTSSSSEEPQKKRKPRSDKGRPRKKQSAEAPPEGAQEEKPTTDPTEQPKAAPKPAPEREAEQVKWQCQRCKRQLSQLKNDKCPYCMGQPEPL